MVVKLTCPTDRHHMLVNSSLDHQVTAGECSATTTSDTLPSCISNLLPALQSSIQRRGYIYITRTECQDWPNWTFTARLRINPNIHWLLKITTVSLMWNWWTLAARNNKEWNKPTYPSRLASVFVSLDSSASAIATASIAAASVATTISTTPTAATAIASWNRWWNCSQ